MRYVLLIHVPRERSETLSEAELRAGYDEMAAFGESLGEKRVASHSLRPDHHAVRVQQRSGVAKLIDGPFTETKEMIGGFYLLDCADMDEALAIAQRCPATRYGTVEVRACVPCYEA